MLTETLRKLWQWNWPLRIQMLVTFGTLMVSSLVVVMLILIYGLLGGLYQGTFTRALHDARTELGLVSRSQQNAVLAWMRERIGDTLMLASDDCTVNYVRQLLHGAQYRTVDSSRALQRMQKFVENYGSFDEVMILDSRDGRVLLSNDVSLIGKRPYPEALIKRVRKAGVALSLQYFTVSKTDDNRLLLSYPVFVPEKGSTPYLLVFAVQSQLALSNTLRTNDRAIGHTVEVVLINSAGNILADAGADKEARIVLAQSPFATLAVTGQQGILEAQWQQHRKIVAFRNLRVTSDENWGLLVVKDKVEVYAPVYMALTQMSLVGVVLLLTILALARLFSMRIADPLTRLADISEHIMAGDFVHRAAAKGSSELRRLAIAFNDMVDHLRQWNLELEGKVVERTLELSKARDVAMQASSAKSEFLARMSHEIRTPMNSVIGMTRLALRYASHPKQKDYLHKVILSSDHLLSVINDILDYSKVEAGKISIETLPFVLDHLLEQLSDITSSRLQDKEVELLFDIDQKLPRRLIGDAMRLNQVLINLLGNAAKFTHDGQIILRIVELGTEDNHVKIEFSVTDTGIGMSQEQQAALFASFTQADASITRKYGGTGLGLAISKQLVELMGGTIKVSSELGQGSRFAFSLRLAIDPAPQSVGNVRVPLLFNRILVVDDNQNARDIVSDMVEHLAVEVVKVASGGEALAYLQRANSVVDLVITDYKMPEMDGIALTKLIRNYPDLDPQLPVIIVTGHDADGLSDEAGKLSVHACMVKPINTSLLYNALAEIKGQYKPSVVLRADSVSQSIDLTPLYGARILLVDDFELNREVAIGILAEAKVWIDVAENGQAAVDMVATGNYDLVLMDIQMPVLDGLSATRQIRGDMRFQKLPIIAMTAHAMTQDRVLSLEAGMNDHIVKPFDPDQLFLILMRWIDTAALGGRDLPAITDDGSHAVMRRSFIDALPVSPAIDWSAGLEKVQGSVPMYWRIVRNFLRDYLSMPERLLGTQQPHLDDTIRIGIHNLKSSATYLGAPSLAKQAATFEIALRHQDQEEMARLLPLVAGTLRETLSVLEDAVVVFEAYESDEPPDNQNNAIGFEVGIDSLRSEFEELVRNLVDGDSRAETIALRLLPKIAPTCQAQMRLVLTLIDDIEFEQALDELEKLSSALDMTLTTGRHS